MGVEITDEMVRAFRVAERTAQGFRKKPNERVRAGLLAVAPLLCEAAYRAGREDAVPPEHVADAAARLRQDIREAIDVCYGELGGEADTPEDVAGTERAIAHDMATVLDWIARGLQPQEDATSQERA